MFFNDVGDSKTYKVGPDGKPAVFLADSKRGDGQAFGPDGRLYANAGAEQQDPGLGRGRQADRDRRRVPRQRPRRPPRRRHLRHRPVRRRRATARSGTSSPKGEKKVVDTGLKFANGITLSPTSRCSTSPTAASHWVYSYQIQPDGSLAHKQKYYHLHVPDTADDSGADGLRVDRDGRLWVATRMGLAGVRPGRAGELHHPDAERQGVEPDLRRPGLRHRSTPPAATRSTAAR